MVLGPRPGGFVEADATSVWWFTNVGQTQNIYLPVNAGQVGAPIKVTLVWTDRPGTLNANPALVNNLNLRVRGSEAIGYRAHIQEARETASEYHTQAKTRGTMAALTMSTTWRRLTLQLP
jgi:hypothetical protein